MQIQPPKECPSCNSQLEWLKDQLYCRNTTCPAKSSKQVEHFAKALKIKGLGPSTIEKLELASISEIYEITLEYASVMLGSEKMAEKLLTEINRSKTEKLNTVLVGFGIPLVGKTAVGKLALVADTIYDINDQVCKQAGLGQKVTENLLNWIEDCFDSYSNLPFDWEFSKNIRSTEGAEVICISGKLKSYPTKTAAKSILEGLGYVVKDSLTKDVTILVNESGSSSAKTLKAEADGLRIITNLKEFIGE